MSRLIWIYAVCKSLLFSSVAMKELRRFRSSLIQAVIIGIILCRSLDSTKQNYNSLYCVHMCFRGLDIFAKF